MPTCATSCKHGTRTCSSTNYCCSSHLDSSRCCPSCIPPTTCSPLPRPLSKESLGASRGGLLCWQKLSSFSGLLCRWWPLTSFETLQKKKTFCFALEQSTRNRQSRAAGAPDLEMRTGRVAQACQLTVALSSSHGSPSASHPTLG